MRSPSLLFAFVFVCGSFVACSGKGAAAGVYLLDRSNLREQMAANGATAAPQDREEQSQMLDKIVAGMAGRIELKADGNAELQFVAAGKSVETKGTWRLVGSTVAIDGTAQNGARETKLLQLHDGSLTLEQPGQKVPMKLVFHRQ